ncbi:MAG TPA: hypothetical protein ENL34_11125 [Chloroflexi bacterium]|nr:hypothetical protein [Chloroflexota bacterium]
MPNKVIDRGYLNIDGDQVLCDSIDIDPEDDSEFAMAMTPDGEPLGVVSGSRRYRVRADVTMRADEAVDFHQLWVDKTSVPTEVQYEGGVTWAFSEGVISKPGNQSSHGEKAKWSIELLCWGLQIS